MPNPIKQFIEESEKKFDEEWIDNLQYSGYEMRVMMKNLSTSQHLALLNVVNKKYEMIGYILKDIKSYSPDGEIGTLCEQGLDILKELQIK